jgi:hypothetical protein
LTDLPLMDLPLMDWPLIDLPLTNSAEVCALAADLTAVPVAAGFLAADALAVDVARAALAAAFVPAEIRLELALAFVGVAAFLDRAAVLARVVLAGVVLASDSSGALVVVLAADFAVLAADLAVFALDDVDAPPLGAALPLAVAIDRDFALPAVGPVFAAPDLLVPADLAEAAVLDAVDLAVLDTALAAEPRDRDDVTVAPPLFAFSFFLADGIRETLLLRPAVETGRHCRPPAPEEQNAFGGKLPDLNT